MPDSHPQRFPMIGDDARGAFLQSDREDLLEVLALRFGAVPESVQARIAACDNAESLERWILVAANAPDWTSFLTDFDAGQGAFKLVGTNYEPIAAKSKPAASPHGPRARDTSDGAQEKEA